MGYYENPPIVQPSRGGEIIASSIANAASSIAEGLIKRGERKREEEKTHELTLQKMRDRKNETDLAYNEKLSEWDSKTPHLGNEVDSQIYKIIRSKIEIAADSRIKLLNETNPEKRQQYLTDVRNADQAMNNAKEFATNIGGATATYRLKTPASTVGEPGGYLVNGDDDTDIENNMGVLDIVSGMTQKYQDHKMSVEAGPNGDDFVLKVSGTRDGKQVSKTINSTDYLKGLTEGDNALLMPVESRDENYKKAKALIVDKDNKIYDGFLGKTFETVNLPSEGQYQMQLVGARPLNTEFVKSKLNEAAEVEANGILGGSSSTATLRTYWKGTLALPSKDFDAFNRLPTEEKKSALTNLITEDNYKKITKGLFSTTEKTDKGEQTTYWESKPPEITVKKELKVKAGGVTKVTKQTESQRKQETLNAQIEDITKNGGTVAGKSGLYLKVENGKGSLFKIDASGLKLPVERAGASFKDMVRMIGGTTTKKALK